MRAWRARSPSVLTSLAFTGTKARILTQKALPGHGDYSVAHPWHAKEVAWNQDNVQDLVNGDRARVLRVLRLLCETALQRTAAGFVKVCVLRVLR